MASTAGQQVVAGSYHPFIVSATAVETVRPITETCPSPRTRQAHRYEWTQFPFEFNDPQAGRRFSR
jgi:hypothetical protein